MGKRSHKELSQIARASAREEVIKSEMLHIRIGVATFAGLYELSEKCNKPLGTMVREWITERVEAQITGKKTLEQRLCDLEAVCSLAETAESSHILVKSPTTSYSVGKDPITQLEKRLVKLERQVQLLVAGASTTRSKNRTHSVVRK